MNWNLRKLIPGNQDFWMNKYFIALVVFLVWITFLDKHSLVTNYRLQQKLTELEQENKSYKAKIAATNMEIEDLNEDLERFAREKYYFQKENEDVFIIVDK